MTVSYLRPPKPFAWSFSRLNNYETCPRKMQQVDLLKNFTEDNKDAVNFGHAFHEAMASRLVDKTPLPATFAGAERWAHRVEAEAATHQATIEAELKLAITDRLQPCDFFDRQLVPWFRGVIDVLIRNGEYATIVDWKTGKIIEDKQQLAMQAQCVFAHYPYIREVGTMYVWTRHNATTTDKFKITDMAPMWINIWPRIDVLHQAHLTNNYPPKPGKLCKNFCPVTTCEYHGKGSYR